MPRKPNPRALATAFLLCSATLSVVILGVRNLYDDEISSLDLVTTSARNILQVAAHGDVHPPGMYLLAHLAYSIVPSFRWMNLFPWLILYAGLAIFLLQVTPLFATSTRSQFCFLLIATLHPQLLLWNTTFRWYSWWTGLALITLTVALQPRNPKPNLGTSRALTLGLLLACLFYLNYITFLLAFALGPTMLLRYRSQPWKRLLPTALVTLGFFLALIAPQLHTMLAVHIPNGGTQTSGLADSVLRLLLSVAASEAYLPWHPLAIAASLLFAALCITGMIAFLRLYRSRSSDIPAGTGPLAAIILFGLLFFLLVAATGLGGRPRNGLLLIPVLATVAALIVGTLRPRWQDAILIFFALWSAIGIAHILSRYGLTRATMNDRPEQVVAFIARTTGPDCAIVVTYDTTLAFSIAHANLPRILILSPFDSPIFGGSRSLPSDSCTRTRLYAVQSYSGEPGSWTRTLNDELQSSRQFIEGQPHTDSFSFDPEAARKRDISRIPLLHGDLAPAAALPDYRYVVTSGPIDRANLDLLRKRMPDFLNGDPISDVEHPG
jgi:hypothetical protein